MMHPTAALAISAAIGYANGDMDLTHFQRTTALCSLWAQGVDKPSITQIEKRIAEMNVAASFISAPLDEGQL